MRREHLQSFVVLSMVLLLQTLPATAQDLGTVGPTYAITEPHLLRMIEQRLQEKERSGELARLQEAARRRAIASVRAPEPVAGLRRTQQARTYFLDPTFTLDRNIHDAQGQLMFPAGTRKNPLEVVNMTRKLLFFDARDARQVERARALLASNQGRIKPVLTGGSYLDLMKSWRVPVYYDQQGLLTGRFGIHQLPALVSQEGLRLRVDELEVKP